MNIGIVTTWFDRGAAYVSKSYADVLSDKHNVYIFARGGESHATNDSRWNKYKVTWGKQFKNKTTTQINWLEYKRWIELNKIELVIFNEQHDWEIIVDSRKLDIKIVAYIDYYKQNTIDIFNLYDAVICNTLRHHSVFMNHNQSYFIAWGTDVETFKPSIKKNNGIITYFHSAGMGGMNLRKGTDLVVRAFNNITNDNVRLVIHSQVSIDKYSSVADIINNNKNIEFIHNTVAPPGLYHLGDIYVYPSRLEGIGLTIIEALSCGLPVITTDCAPMNEFVVDGVNGKLVKVDKYVSRPDGYYWPESLCCEKALQLAMEYFIDNNNQLNEMKQRTRDHAVRYMNWVTNAAELNVIVSSIISDPQKHLNYEKYKDAALHYAFSSRRNGECLYTKIVRKLTRKVLNLD